MNLATAMKLRVEPVREDDRRWRDTLAAAGPGPHASRAWRSYRREMGWQELPLLLQDEEGRAVAAGLAWERRPRWRPWVRPDVTLDRLPWCPSSDADPDALVEAQVEALLVHGRERRWRRLQLNSFDVDGPRPHFEGAGWSRSERLEFPWPLGPDEGARLAAMKGSHRRKMRKAQKAGVVVEESEQPADLDHLRTLQGETRDRRAERGESMDCPRDEQYGIMGRSLMPGGARLFLGRLDGEVVSAILLCVEGRRAYYFLGGTSPRGLAANAATLVMWDASCRLYEDGVEVLNLGGVPARAEDPDSPEHGLFRFKDGWGAPRVPCRSGSWEAKETGR